MADNVNVLIEKLVSLHYMNFLDHRFHAIETKANGNLKLSVYKKIGNEIKQRGRSRNVESRDMYVLYCFEIPISYG